MNEVSYLQEAVTRGVVRYIMEDEGVGLQDALVRFVDSRTFRLLMNPETHLYRESPAYVFEMLQREQRAPTAKE